MTLLLPVVVVVAGPAAVWLFVHGHGWKIELVAMGPAISACLWLAGFVERGLARRHEKFEAPAPQRLTSELLERWRASLLDAVTKLRVDDGGQLAKMVRQGDPVDAKVARVDHDAGRPRVRISGRLLAWSEITRRWEASPGRLVILGDPGYGKTVAALTLVKHINARAEPGASVAELFALAEWQRWRGEHPAAPFADWLVEQLTVAHPAVPAMIARELVDARLIVPVLDGLDEIATVEHRRACVAAIDAYAGAGKPHRSFVLTCRAREYRELAPDWVRDDDCVVLVGLQPDQVRRRLREQTAGRPAWDVLRERQAAGDRSLDELFVSPLRLAIALQVYRDRDPDELLKLTVAQARGRLWEGLLESNADGYRGATSTQVRGWLAWLAAGMRRTNRQRFMLHELYLLDPQSSRNIESFRVVVALVLGLLGGMGGALVVELGGGRGSRVIDGLVVGLVVGLVLGRGGGLGASSQPLVREQLHWKVRLRYTTRAHILIGAVRWGLFNALLCAAGVLAFGGGSPRPTRCTSCLAASCSAR